MEGFWTWNTEQVWAMAVSEIQPGGINESILLTQIRRVEAVSPGKGEASTGRASVLRGSSLEIVDDQGRVRASKIHSGDPKFKMPDGKTGDPETVMFRLIDPRGRPEVKLGASVEGAGLGLIGETDSTHIILEAQSPESSLKFGEQAGRQQLIEPYRQGH